jgi:hypothetical protein
MVLRSRCFSQIAEVAMAGADSRRERERERERENDTLDNS